MEEKASVLIVDDNMSLLKTMSFVLIHKGYAVTTAEDGAKAIEVVKEKPFDVIFMDIKMPLMNGVQTYRQIKKTRPDAVVMMMTAYSVEDLVKDALEEGAYGIIYKPMDIEEVVAIIERARKRDEGTFVLVVDDNPETLTTFKNVLTTKGYSVAAANNGDEAFTMAQEKAYNIIFIDMKLPTINGLETYLAIKEVNPEVVAVMITAYHQEVADLVQEAVSNNAYTCLYKPLDMQEVLRLVEEITKRNRG